MKTRIKEPCFNQIRYREFKFTENTEILLFSCDFITFHCFVIFGESDEICAIFGWPNAANFTLVT